MTSKYYVSGVIEIEGTCGRVADEDAEFWTVYERQSDGTTLALCDCYTRKAADEVAMKLRALDGLPVEALIGGWTAVGLSKYTAKYTARLEAQIAALKDALRRSEDYCVGVDTERMDYIKRCETLTAESVKARNAVAVFSDVTQQVPVVPWDVKSCHECGSKSLTWQATVISNTPVQNGRLRLNEVSGLFYLGCDECSETVAWADANEVACFLNACHAEVLRYMAKAAADKADLLAAGNPQ